MPEFLDLIIKKNLACIKFFKTPIDKTLSLMVPLKVT